MTRIVGSGERTDLNEAADLGARSSLNVAGIGRIYVWSGGSVWIGRDAGRTQPHAHHAIQVTLAQDRPVRLRPCDERDWAEYRGAVVRHNERHQFDGCGARVAQVFVEPETAAGRVLLTHHGDAPIRRLRDDLADELAQALFARFAATRAEAPMIAAAQDVIEQLAGGVVPAPAIDARLQRALDALRTRLDGVPTLADAAAVAHLSPSRFRHLFVAQMRTPFRCYVLWLRLNAAIEAFNRGHNWTVAAHHAGFADSAHLSRTFRRMFGVSPVMLLQE